MGIACLLGMPHMQDLRNIEALKSSPYVNTSSKRTPYAQQLHQQPSYIISPYRYVCCCQRDCTPY